MLTLREIRGPECPKCGCCDSTVGGVSSWWGTPQEQRLCRHCGRRFAVTQGAASRTRPKREQTQPAATPDLPGPWFEQKERGDT